MDTDVVVDELRALLGSSQVTTGAAINPDDLHDESLHFVAKEPLAVLRPRSTSDVQGIARLATRHGLAITPRGSGTGLSGASVPVDGGLLIAFDQMKEILRVDTGDHVAVVQPGLTLRELNEALADTGLCYPVYPGELSGSLGGNVNTNAGGMRAVRYGVTRQHVLGLEVVLMNGSVLRTGGPVVKSSSGYDLTQLLVGSEGTLGLVTEVTLRLSPRLAHSATLLVPFTNLTQVTDVVPSVVASGLSPSLLEYLDVLTMSSVTNAAGIDLGVSESVVEHATAYLVIVLETRTREQLDLDIEFLSTLVEPAGALDLYVLPAHAGTALIEAREKAFWVAKAAGAHDIVDVVVPRSRVTTFLADVHELATRYDAFVAGCGHVGDGNVHLSVFQPDEKQRTQFLDELFREGVQLGGAVSGEHGIGRDKQAAFLTLSDPLTIELQRRLKSVFDPDQLLNPYRLLDARPEP